MCSHPGHDPECSILVLLVNEILSHSPRFRVFASLPGMAVKHEYEASLPPVKFFNQLINLRSERKNAIPVRIVIVPL